MTHSPSISHLPIGTARKLPHLPVVARTSAVLLGTALLLLCGGRASADKISITVATSTIRFQDSNPDLTPSVPAVENPVAVSVDFSGNGTWVLQVIANGDLISGAEVIPINRVSWTSSGAAFVPGTLSKSSGQTVASGGKSNTPFNGSLRFFLQNSWNYATGNYGQSLTFTAVSF